MSDIKQVMRLNELFNAVLTEKTAKELVDSGKYNRAGKYKDYAIVLVSIGIGEMVLDDLSFNDKVLVGHAMAKLHVGEVLKCESVFDDDTMVPLEDKIVSVFESNKGTKKILDKHGIVIRNFIRSMAHRVVRSSKEELDEEYAYVNSTFGKEKNEQ